MAELLLLALKNRCVGLPTLVKNPIRVFSETPALGIGLDVPRRRWAGLATDSDDGYSPLGFALWLDSCNPDFGMQVGLKPFVMTLVNFAGGVFR